MQKVVKMSENYETIGKEIKIINKMAKQSSNTLLRNFPKIINYGMLAMIEKINKNNQNENGENILLAQHILMAFYIMPKYEKNLNYYC